MASKNNAKAPASETLLVELLTEELPPNSLAQLGRAFMELIYDGLVLGRFLVERPIYNPNKVLATPRRLAAVIPNVLHTQQEGSIDRKGPAVTAGIGTDGKPTPALLGFAKSCGVTIEALHRVKDAKGEYFVFRSVKPGEPLEQHLAGIVQVALKKLPTPKIMRWGDNDVEFLRPVHGLVMLHGAQVVSGKVLGLGSTNHSLGHRFLSTAPIKLGHADDYERLLRGKGNVIASFAGRRADIVKQIATAAGKAAPVADDVLLDEITALVEAPAVYAGEFSTEFLAVPEECLILSMQQHQKYVPLRDKETGQLLSRFLFVSNIDTKQPREIIHGNERVLRARLADARFFYDQDRKTRLEARVPRLAKVVYHGKLGSQLERVERIKLLAGRIAREIGADPMLAERAAWLSKADLLTEMVGEFPELQGVMGRYYALHDGERKEVADAIEAHYRPRFSGGELPKSPVDVAVALADKLDALAGLFSIGQQPTGDKDPFGLRRAALGIIRIIVEKRLPILSDTLVNLAFPALPMAGTLNAGTDLLNFLDDRLRSYLREQGHSAQEVDTVLSAGTLRLAEVPAVLEAVKRFQQLPEAADLAAANKRIVNIIRKAGVERVHADASALVEPAERALFDALQGLKPEVESKFQSHDYTGALQVLARLKQPVDTFFDKVMVMTDDARVRENRLALLGDLKALMNRVADISKLAT
jgi:glycyl-tRNA synthetase beta chain